MIAKYFAEKIPSFYLEILKAWFQFKKSDKQNDIYSDNQILLKTNPFYLLLLLLFFFLQGLDSK